MRRRDCLLPVAEHLIQLLLHPSLLLGVLRQVQHREGGGGGYLVGRKGTGSTLSPRELGRNHKTFVEAVILDCYCCSTGLSFGGIIRNSGADVIIL